MAALSWNVPLFVEDRMVGVAHVQIMEDGGLLIQAGSTEDPQINIEDLPHMSGYSLILQSVKNSGVKVLTATQWMNELQRWWNYETIGNMDEILLTKSEFLNYMARNGTEMTNVINQSVKGVNDGKKQ